MAYLSNIPLRRLGIVVTMIVTYTGSDIVPYLQAYRVILPMAALTRNDDCIPLDHT